MKSVIIEVGGKKLEFLPPQLASEVREMGIKCDAWENYADMTHAQAIEYCEKVGGRLPTLEELYELHLQLRKSAMGWPKRNGYWSSAAGNSRYYNVHFNYGYTVSNNNSGSSYVSCVRVLQEN